MGGYNSHPPDFPYNLFDSIQLRSLLNFWSNLILVLTPKSLRLNLQVVLALVTNLQPARRAASARPTGQLMIVKFGMFTQLSS